MPDNDYETKSTASKTQDDGTNHFFGGSDGTPDGPGHGHIVNDAEGNIVYAREAEQEMPGTSRSERVSENK
jgi:hypothetical protein